MQRYFVVQEDTLYYIDYKCNDYMEEWNFENWGIYYWSQTKEFLEYVHKEKNCWKSKNFKRVSEFIVIMKMTTLNQAVEKLKAGFWPFFTGKDAFIVRMFILTMRVSGNYNKENGRLHQGTVMSMMDIGQFDKIKWKL